MQMGMIGEIVIKNKKGNLEATGEYVLFDQINDVFKITIWEPKWRKYHPLYHTSKGMVTILTTLDAIAKAHKHLGLVMLDPVNVVAVPNISEVKVIHGGAIRAYYESDVLDEESKEAIISTPKRKFVQHLIKKIKG